MVQATTAEAEWIRIADVTPRFGIRRSKCFELLSSGAIKSRVIRNPGNVRGVRLISVESIRHFIESQPED